MVFILMGKSHRGTFVLSNDLRGRHSGTSLELCCVLGSGPNEGPEWLTALCSTPTRGTGHKRKSRPSKGRSLSLWRDLLFSSGAIGDSAVPLSRDTRLCSKVRLKSWI